MKINGPTLKLKPLQLLIGVGIIMAGFLSEVNAAPFKCTRCNLSAKKCATDQKYFETCVSRCPTKNNKNPIPKCTKAHYDAIQASKPSTDALSELLYHLALYKQIKYRPLKNERHSWVCIKAKS